MKLTYRADNKSVKFFKEIEINNLSFFTGKNGSGKTHLLDAITNGKISVDAIAVNEILYLNYSNFSINFQTKTDYSHKINAWNRLNSSGDIMFQLKIHENLIGDYKNSVEETAIKLEKPIFELLRSDFKNNQDQIILAINNYKNMMISIFNQDNYKNDDLLQSVYESVIMKSEYFLSSLSENTFKKYFQKTSFGGRKILSDLSTLFYEYKMNLDRNDLNRAKEKHYLTQELFEDKYGNPPWLLIRNIFEGFNLGFDINDPIQEEIDTFSGSFEIKFINTLRSNKVIPFNDLSSGEQILITLVNSIYTAIRKNNLPKLLLLDEIDGPLNPSVIEKFIQYIKNNFVNQGIKVIIATHSPTTVAFAPENSTYVINTNIINPIKNENNSVAIDMLSEGFATFSGLLEIKKIKESKIIISEGKNYNILNKAKEYFGSDLDLFILNKRSLGSGVLRNLFDFIRIFNQSKEFIYVWDSDYRMKDQENNQTLPRDLTSLKNSTDKNNRVFIFENNVNGIVLKGIENLFDQEVKNGYLGSITNTEVINKDHFKNYLFKRNNKNDFKNFESLFIFIKSDITSNL